MLECYRVPSFEVGCDTRHPESWMEWESVKGRQRKMEIPTLFSDEVPVTQLVEPLNPVPERNKEARGQKEGPFRNGTRPGVLGAPPKAPFVVSFPEIQSMANQFRGSMLPVSPPPPPLPCPFVSKPGRRKRISWRAGCPLPLPEGI